jgi:hypothetical protein
MDPQELLILQYLAAQAALRANLLNITLGVFDNLDDYRDANAALFAETVTPIVAEAQLEMSDLTAAYLAEQIALMSGEDLSLPPAMSFGTDYRNGTDPMQVYLRPFSQIYKDLADGKPFDKALEAGRNRAESIVSTDLQLAKRQTAYELVSESGTVQGYRRVLTGAENCGLCVVASTQRYHKRELLPIHPGCDCAVAPILGHEDPGQTINTAMVGGESKLVGTTKSGARIYAPHTLTDSGDLLEPVHNAIQDRFGVSDRGARAIDYRKVLSVHQHGELGPLLTVKTHKFTGEKDLPGK